MIGRVARAGMVARWKPVHLGHAAVLEGLVAHADHVTIGVGSSNRHDVRSPFTYGETEEMLRLVLPAGAAVTIVPVPDLGDGPRWAAMVRELFGPLDLFATANPWVRDLLAPHYPLVHPVFLVPEEKRVAVDGTMVREAMLRGAPWEHLVPPAVARFLVERGLVSRFVAEFGGPGAGPR